MSTDTKVAKWRKRNVILVILWFVFLISYLDRVNFAVTLPVLSKELNFSPSQSGMIMSAFFAGYALLQIVGGIFSDKLGAGRMITIALTWWSAFTAFTGMVGSFSSMVIVRLLFGAGEALHPPAAFKLLSSWFPKEERARANAWNLCSAALGPAFAPLLVVGIMQTWGWRSVFFVFAIPGLLVAVATWLYVRNTPEEHPSITQEELAEIRSTSVTAAQNATPVMTLGEAVKVRNLWLMAVVYFAFGVTFWGFISWLPSYLVKERGFTMIKMGITASIPYFTAFVAMLVAGYITDALFKNRKKQLVTGLYIFAALFMYLAYATSEPNLCVLYLSLTAACLFTSMSLFWALTMDLLPSSVMGFSSGFINTGAQIGGFIAPTVIGFLIEKMGGSFAAGFTFMEISLLAAAVVITFIKQNPDEATT
jgi:sugar phosphate permease